MSESDSSENSNPLGSDPSRRGDSLSARLKVDELCDRFEAAWLEGQSPRVEEFLAAVAPVYRSAALHELLKVDSHYRRKAGDPPSKDEYRERFPGLASEWLREELEPKRAAWASTGGARPTPHATGIVFATIANRDTSGARIAVANDLPRIPGYDVLEMLGRGGMGVVYKARDLLLRRLVALKMISSGMAVGPEMLERFRAEARAVAALQHPHLVQIHEVGEHEGRPYLVFEFMAGGSLDARLGGVPQAPLYSAQLIKKVAKAIQFVHARGFVHRDLKPANILLTGKLSGGEMWCANEVDLPKVGDFGLAKQLEDDDARTRTGAILGTPSYMAPEQADGRVGSIGPTTDVYSLGAILYEMLTGRPPFKASTVLETLDQVRQAEPVALRRIQPNVPRDLETICLKCLRKEPARRYESADALADDLDRFLRDEPVLARPISAMERTWRWCRRRPVVASLTALLMIITLVGVGGIFHQWRQAEAARALAEDNARQVAQQRDEARRMRLEAEANLRDVEAARERGERVLYLRNINATEGALRSHHYSEATALLQSCRSDLRDWEWRHLQRRLRLGAKTLEGLALPATRVAVAPDGKTLIAATGTWLSTSRSELALWEFPSGRLLETRRPHVASILDVAVHPSGSLLATAGFNGLGRDVAKLSDFSSGRELAAIAEGVNPMALAFSPDGRWLAVAASNGRVYQCEATTGRVVRTLDAHARNVFCLAFSPDSRRLASGSHDGSLRLWDTSTGENVRTLNDVGDIRGVAYSPDGQFLAAITFLGFLKVWDVDGRVELNSYHTRHQGGQAISFSPDGQWLACASNDAGVLLWDPMTGAVTRSLPGHWRSTTSIGFSPCGRWLVTAGGDGLLRIHDLAVEPDGRKLYVQNSPIADFDLSPCGELVATAAGERKIAPRDNDKSVRLWSVSEERELAKLNGHTDWLTSVAFSPDGRHVASGSRDRSVRIWEVASGASVRTLAAHDSAVRTVAYSPDGQTIVSGGEDGRVRLWDVSTGELVRTLTGLADGAAPNRATFTRDGRFLISSFDPDGLGIWPMATPDEPILLCSQSGRPSPVKVFAVSPDQRWLAGAGDDRKIRLWNFTAVMRELRSVPPEREIETNDEHISSLEFSPNSRRLVSSSIQNGATLWDVATGVGVPLTGAGASRIRFSKDGHRLVAIAGGNVSVWDDRLPVEPDREEQTRRSSAWHLKESRSAEQRGLPFAVLHHLRFLPPGESNDDVVRVRRAVANVQVERWSAAADEFEQLARDDIDARRNAFHAALLRLRGGDQAAYHALCGQLRDALRTELAFVNADRGGGLSRIEGPRPANQFVADQDAWNQRAANEDAANQDAVNTVAWACCFGEQDAMELDCLRVRLEEVLARTKSRDARLERLNTLGAVLYRLGRTEDAIEKLDEAVQGRGQGGVVEDWLFLAMAYHRTERTDEARVWLSRARAEIEKLRGVSKPAERRRYVGSWESRVALEILLQEAEGLINSGAATADSSRAD